MFTLLALIIIGCTSMPVQPISPLQPSAAAASFAAPELGIATDLELRVTGIQPGSVAESVDIQVGDILVDLKWNQAAMPEAAPDQNVIVLDAEGRPTYNGEVITEPVAVPPATDTVEQMEQYIETEAIPFTELSRIVSLVGYGLPLELRLLRNGEELTIQITPGPRTQPLMTLPERTDPEEHAYYYF